MSSTSVPLARGHGLPAQRTGPSSTVPDTTVQALLNRRPIQRRAPAPSTNYHPEVIADVRHALDRLLAQAEHAGAGPVASELIGFLELLKANFAPETWREAVVPTARSHAIGRLIHECPFTRHSFLRPRGYPGDAGLIDFVYRHEATRAAVEAATEAGRAVMDHTVNVSACEAVRQRKQILAAKIDEAALRCPDAEILAVACGHLREAESSQALRDGGIRRFLATDQDETSLRIAAAGAAACGTTVETRTLSVRNFITAKQQVGTFDFIYAAGLYDYLEARVAARLTKSLFDRLKPGGRLLIPNFLHGVREEGYMETFMDWFLLYRTPAEIEAFASLIPEADLARAIYSEDGFGRIGYLEVEKS
jgi:extracellular factor (EF) 3-hydroxypalmitic acid methyl ester biosynthesis protein